MLRGLAARFALFLFDGFLAQFSFGGERASVDDAEGFFFLVVGQGSFLSSCVLSKFSIGSPVLGSGAWYRRRALRNAGISWRSGAMLSADHSAAMAARLEAKHD